MTKRILLICAFVLALGVQAKAQTIAVDDICVEPGKTGEFTVCLSGGQTNKYTSMTLNVQFPKEVGITTADNFEIIYPAWKNSLVAEADMTQTSLQSGTLGVVGAVDENGLAVIPFASSEPINQGATEELVKIRFNVPAETPEATYDVTLKSTEFGYEQTGKDIAGTVTFKVVVKKNSVIKGDANGDGKVSILDVTTAIDSILGNNPQPFVFEAADVNEDGKISITDVTSIIDIILGN